MKNTSFLASDHAVSETVGYILVLGILSMTIAITFATGYPILQNSMDDSHLQNMENGFILMGKGIDRITSQDAPAQSIELKLKGGSLTTSKNGSFNTSLTYVNGSQVDLSWEKMGINYKYRGRQIGYELGGVMENINGDSYVLDDPKIIKGDPFIIPINILWGSDTGVAGEGLAKVTLIGGSPTLHTYENVRTVNMSVKSDYYMCWAVFFNRTLGMVSTVDQANTTAYATYADNDADGMHLMIMTQPLTIDIT